MKKIICFVLILLVFFTPIYETEIFANNNGNRELYYAQYSGIAESSGYSTNCIFTINQINGSTFSGRFAAPDLPGYSFDEAVQGSISLSSESYTCTFTVYFRTYYYSNVTVVVYPRSGIAICNCDGSFHSDETFSMSGTVDKYYSQNFSYNENDMKMCMDFSNTVYQGDNNEEESNQSTEHLFTHCRITHPTECRCQ